MLSSRLASRLLALAVGFGLLVAPARGYESDQYLNRGIELADSREVLNAVVNDAIHSAAAEWRGRRDDYRFARRIYWRVGGLFWVDHIERMAMERPEIARAPRAGRNGIFAGAPWWVARVQKCFGVGPTIRLAGTRLGTDKLGHFFSQGVKYFGSRERRWSEEKILDRGRTNERLIFGQLTTSVYSNADLVANYEGYLFYRSLFEDGIVPGKGSIVRWKGDRPVVERDFDWADHVNDYWDEALNPSHFGRGMHRFLQRKLPSLCDEVRRRPELYVSADEEALRQRYAHIGLKPAPELRLDGVCAEGSGQ